MYVAAVGKRLEWTQAMHPGERQEETDDVQKTQFCFINGIIYNYLLFQWLFCCCDKYPEIAVYLQFQDTAYCLGEIKAATMRITSTNQEQSKNKCVDLCLLFCLFSYLFSFLLHNTFAQQMVLSTMGWVFHHQLIVKNIPYIHTIDQLELVFKFLFPGDSRLYQVES